MNTHGGPEISGTFLRFQNSIREGHKNFRGIFEISKGPSEISERVLKFQGGVKEVYENPEEPSEVSVQGSFEPFDQTEISGRILRFYRTFCYLREGYEIQWTFLRTLRGMVRSQGGFLNFRRAT